MLTSSDSNLRNMIKELYDHGIVSANTNDEGVEQIFIPHSSKLLQEILEFKR